MASSDATSPSTPRHARRPAALRPRSSADATPPRTARKRASLGPSPPSRDHRRPASGITVHNTTVRHSLSLFPPVTRADADAEPCAFVFPEPPPSRLPTPAPAPAPTDGDAGPSIEAVLAGPLRHLAGSRPRAAWPLRPASAGGGTTRLGEQRHPGKEGAYISRSTRPWVPLPPPPPRDQRHPGKRGAYISVTTKPWVPPQDDEPRHAAGKAGARGGGGAGSWVPCVGRGGAAATATAGDGCVHGVPLLCLVAGLMLAVFSVSADRLVITTALSHITAQMESAPDIGWYGSAYLLATSAVQPVFGRVFSFFSVKDAYLLALFFFGTGSLLCGHASTSATLIVGRAIAGLGSAGVLTGSFVIVFTAAPAKVRPTVTAIVGTMVGVGATVGPLLGGAFADLVSWHWCFYFNLPVVGATAVAIILFFEPSPRQANRDRTRVARLLELDLVGVMLLLGASVMLFLGLGLSAHGDQWQDSGIIGLLCGSGVTAILFIAAQWRKGDQALIPPRIATQRTIAASCIMTFLAYGALINLIFFLPLWFQTNRGTTAVQAGVDMIPFFAVDAVFYVLGGLLVSQVGYATPLAVVGNAIGTVGLGLLRRLDTHTTAARWAGYEVLAAAGFGLSMQQGLTAVQTVLGPDDVAVGTAAVVAAQNLGGAVFLSVGNCVFQSQTRQASAASRLGRDSLEADGDAFRDLFTLSIPLAGLAVIASCFIEFRCVKRKRSKSAGRR